MSSHEHYILVHGLNIKPEAMLKFAKDLGWREEQCSLITLPGHGDGGGLPLEASRRWLKSFKTQYEVAYQENSKNVIVGYSLGGLLSTYLLAKEDISLPDKMILLAPALAFHTWTLIPKWLPGAKLDKLRVPSFAPSQYQDYWGVAIGTYKDLFRMSEELEVSDLSPANVPTLVLCDQWDELVRFSGLASFIKTHKLENWRLEVLPSKRWDQWGKKHLFIAKEFFSENYWLNIQGLIQQFLQNL